MTSHSDEQKLRNETMENDRKVREQASTFFQHAQSSIDDELGGRFAKTNSTAVTGSTPLPSFPPLPPSSPWAGPDPVPIEPPLGYNVDALEHPGHFSPVEAQVPTPAAPSPLTEADGQRGVGSSSEEEPPDAA
jgi:hypothetical protein